jgi:hypothetical protein
MFTSLSIKSFRGFKEVEVGSLGRVNLIAGSNGVGKTALLEAIYMLAGGTNVGLVVKIHSFRGFEKIVGLLDEVAESLWGPLFYDFDTKGVIEIEGQWHDATKHRIEMELVPRVSAPVSFDDQGVGGAGATASGLSSKALQVKYTDASGQCRESRMEIVRKSENSETGMQITPPPQTPSFPGYFLAAKTIPLEEDATCFDELVVRKDPYDVREVLLIIEPRLAEMRPVKRAGVNVLWGDIGLSRMFPVALMGDGLVRLTSILVRIATAGHGIVLIDEIENGFHYTVLGKVWAAIGEAARRFDAQVFATTHSWECIRAAHEAFAAGGTYDLRLHRLDRVNGEIQAVTFDQEMLETALATDLEVR